MGRGRHAHKGIGGAHARGERLAINIRLKVITQEASVAVVDLVEAGNCRSGVSEGFGRDALRGQHTQCGVHVVDCEP
jgi:hypothetical protein